MDDMTKDTIEELQDKVNRKLEGTGEKLREIIKLARRFSSQHKKLRIPLPDLWQSSRPQSVDLKNYQS